MNINTYKYTHLYDPNQENENIHEKSNIINNVIVLIDPTILLLSVQNPRHKSTTKIK